MVSDADLGMSGSQCVPVTTCRRAARGLSDVDERGFDLAEGRERSMWQETRRMEVVFSERPRH